MALTSQKRALLQRITSVAQSIADALLKIFDQRSIFDDRDYDVVGGVELQDLIDAGYDFQLIDVVNYMNLVDELDLWLDGYLNDDPEKPTRRAVINIIRAL